MLTIETNEAAIWTQRWQAEIPLKAILFHHQELQNVFNETAASRMRFYLGLNSGALKMMIVGVDAQGKDIIGNETNSLIYDFGLPCPPTCDVNSPLFHGDGATHSKSTGKGTIPGTTLPFEVPLSEAMAWAQAWQESYQLKAFLFNVSDIQAISNELNANTIRIYGAVNQLGNRTILLVATDIDGNDLPDQGIYINSIYPCPGPIGNHDCDTSSPLYFSS